MRFYKNQHTYYCGIDLHSKVMYVCVMDQAGAVLVHRNIPANPERLLKILEPYRDGVVVGVECMYCWYWLADLCADEGIPFVLGHALYMKAVHGGKAKNDKIDSEKIALLLKGGMFPEAYAYPKEMRSTRDLMRRRSFFVRKRAELYAHVQMTYHQHNFENPGQKLAYRGNREKLEKPFKDDSTLRAVDADLVLIEHYSDIIRSLETHIDKLTRRNSPHSMSLAILKTIPGIGSVLASTILYEIDDIKRFPSVQHFASYARLIKPKKTSAGKTTGGGGGKIGNQHLK
jgi:transposase